MSQQTDTVAKFLSSVKSGQLAADLLTEDAGFQSLNVNQKGKAAIVERFKGGNYAEANWAAPEDKAGAVQAVGTLPNASKIVLTVHVSGGMSGGKINLLQQQGVPGNPRAASELKIPADLKTRLDSALKERHPIMITYVDESGQPNLTFRGSTQVFSDHQLAIWVRNGNGKMIKSIQTYPKVALMYRDEDA
jgi:hypothetical protein